MREPETITVNPQAPKAADDPFASAFAPLATLAGAAFVALTAVICLFALFGQSFAERMSSRVGDIEAVRAGSLYESGLVENAITAYQKALAMKFDDPDQRRWALRRFGELLLNEKRPEDAVPILKECLAAFPDYLPAHELLCQALEQVGRSGELVDASNAMFAAAADNRGSQSAAKYYLGCAWEKLGKADEALAAWTEGQALDPRGRCAYRAANLLRARGEEQRALEMLRQVPEDLTGSEADASRALRAEIEAAQNDSPKPPQPPAGG
jgi:tetratricopeptide (TPR) repeat protein